MVNPYTNGSAVYGKVRSLTVNTVIHNISSAKKVSPLFDSIVNMLFIGNNNNRHALFFIYILA